VPAIIGFYQGRQVALNVASFDELTAAQILDFGGSMLPHAPALLSATQADAFLKAGSVPTPSSASYSSSSSSSPDALPAAAKVKVVLLYNKRAMPLVFRVMAAKFHGTGSTSVSSHSHRLDRVWLLLFLKLPPPCSWICCSFFMPVCFVIFTHSHHNASCAVSRVSICATADTMSFGMVATNTQNPAFEHLANIYGLQGRKLPIFIVQKEGKTAPIVREWAGMFLSHLPRAHN
jgi:hypothetical protein